MTPKLVKRGPVEDDPTDLGLVTVIDNQDATATVERYRFEVVEKRRQNVRKTKSLRAQKYGGGAEQVDNGGICAGEVLRLKSRMQIVEGRSVTAGPQHIPQHVASELYAEGADEVKA